MKTTEIRLNRFLARSGICSRRKADILIARGEVEVNGKVITQMGFQVSPSDIVKFEGKRIHLEKPVYILLNKPIGVLTTTEDPQGRATVMDLIAGVEVNGLFPVGRLDRDTTGLLLLTNDGTLAQKLSHPKYQIQKIYHAYLDRPLQERDLGAIARGISLEDGAAKVDSIQYCNKKRNPKKIEIALHMGRKRVVRRIFEALGYEVITLDRSEYAGLDKKKLPPGQWRYLKEREVEELKELVSV